MPQDEQLSKRRVFLDAIPQDEQLSNVSSSQSDKNATEKNLGSERIIIILIAYCNAQILVLRTYCV